MFCRACRGPTVGPHVFSVCKNSANARVVDHPCTLHIVLFFFSRIHSNALTCLTKRVYFPFQRVYLPFKRGRPLSFLEVSPARCGFESSASCCLNGHHMTLRPNAVFTLRPSIERLATYYSMAVYAPQLSANLDALDDSLPLTKMPFWSCCFRGNGASRKRSSSGSGASAEY